MATASSGGFDNPNLYTSRSQQDPLLVVPSFDNQSHTNFINLLPLFMEYPHTKGFSLTGPTQPLQDAKTGPMESHRLYYSPQQGTPGLLHPGALDHPDDDGIFDLNVDGQTTGNLPSALTWDGGGGSSAERNPQGCGNGDGEGGGKRGKGDVRTVKKPGRKPGRKLSTSEPTSKRVARNRNAQRAFRMRRENHLRDLETKVADLESVSKFTKSENSRLHAQVSRLQTEIEEYQKMLHLVSNIVGTFHQRRLPSGSVALTTPAIYLQVPSKACNSYSRGSTSPPEPM
ncbi:MAG: DNA-binding transcription factor yap1 [Geoglossum simile]|nr:MAG: DNA-binding transcription factor yap1 [Geoglossum simile]